MPVPAPAEAPILTVPATPGTIATPEVAEPKASLPAEGSQAPEAPGTPETLPTTAPETLDSHLSFKEELKTFFQEHPEKAEVFKKGVASLRIALFETPEIDGLPQYDYAVPESALGKSLVAQVISDYDAIEADPSSSYDTSLNPFHPSQMANLDRLTVAAEKGFGEIGKPKAAETVGEYTQRVMLLFMQRKMENPSFTFKF